jgi:hypothetical protein
MRTVPFASRNCDDLIAVNLPVADTKQDGKRTVLVRVHFRFFSFG